MGGEQTAYLQRLEREGNYVEKGVYDYMYALQHCYDTGTPFIGMFEDDVLLAHGWLVRTLLGLRRILSHDEPSSWLFMRLFNQERSTTWASRSIGGNNEHWIILGIGLGVSALAYLAQKKSRMARSVIDPATMFVLVAILNPALVILFYQSGKASVLPPSPGVFKESFGCCAQALVFPRQQVPGIMDFLRQKQRGQLDLMLDELAVTEGLARYALYPVQLQHIGEKPALQDWKSPGSEKLTLPRTRLGEKHASNRSAGYLEHGIRRS